VAAGIAAMVAIAMFIVIPLTPSFDLWNADVQTRGGSRLITESFLVKNTSLGAQRVAAADLDAPGIRVIRTNAPLTIPTNGHAWVRVVYRVTDCGAATAVDKGAPFPMNLRLDRWWGVCTVTLADHGLDYSGPSDVCP
jgi:hypothetical protein